jgi:hypothetical protein
MKMKMKMTRTTYTSVSKIVELNQCEYNTGMISSNDMTADTAGSEEAKPPVPGALQ